MKKILFYPGTFNPPHFGHISAVTVALNAIDCDEVWIMPGGKRVDKEIATSFEDRKNLAVILVECLKKKTNVPIILKSGAVDTIDGKYTHEYIVVLKSETDGDIFQLVGIDGYLGIKERVIGPEEKFVIMRRSGYEFPEEITPNANRIILDEVVGGISSTKIREMVKAGDEDYKKLVPEEVAAYIEERGLYL
jgi:nicotinate-nucleotide adenylyltransferase